MLIDAAGAAGDVSNGALDGPVVINVGSLTPRFEKMNLPAGNQSVDIYRVNRLTQGSA